MSWKSYKFLLIYNLTRAEGGDSFWCIANTSHFHVICNNPSWMFPQQLITVSYYVPRKWDCEFRTIWNISWGVGVCIVLRLAGMYSALNKQKALYYSLFNISISVNWIEFSKLVLQPPPQHHCNTCQQLFKPMVHCCLKNWRMDTLSFSTLQL